MSETETERMTGEESEVKYGLATPKQTSAIDVYVEGDYDTQKAGAEKAGVSQSYFKKVGDEFADVIEYRQNAMRYVADGSGSEYVDVRLTTDEAFKAIRMLPAELSQVVYQAVRNNRQ